MKLPMSLVFALPYLTPAHPIIVEHTEIPNRPIQTHDDPIHALHPRDSITIDIKSLFSNSTVTNTQNNANGKFEVVNNANDANIAMGDNSNHTADTHSFGDKIMLNSTGSNTGGWNTNNRDTNLTNGQKEKRASEQKLLEVKAKKNSRKERRFRNFGARQTRDGYRWDGNMPSGRPGAAKNRNAADCEPTGYAYLAEQCVPTTRTKSKSNKPAKPNSTNSALHKRDQVNLNLITRDVKASNLTRSGNNNAVEPYIAGGGDNIVNITVSLEAENSALENSNNNNAVKLYIGEAERVNKGNSTVLVDGERRRIGLPL